MSQIRIGVLRGGPSSEYDVSLKTGAAVLEHLPPAYRGIDILLDREGLWHHQGLPIHPTNLAGKVDLIFNCLHGAYGEDGEVQHLLDRLSIPYTGSGHLAARLSINKILTKEALKKAGLKMPRHVAGKAGDDGTMLARQVFNSFAPPYIIKPVDQGSSVGLFFVPVFQDLSATIELALSSSGEIMIEEYIKGKEATCGVVEGLRGQEFYSLLPIEIRPAGDKKVFDYTGKYSGETAEICPGRFAPEEKNQLERAAALIHEQLGLRHYSRSDFIVSPRGIYFLEVNALPGLTTESLLPKALKAVGVTYSQFLDHVISRALGANRRRPSLVPVL